MDVNQAKRQGSREAFGLVLHYNVSHGQASERGFCSPAYGQSLSPAPHPLQFPTLPYPDVTVSGFALQSTSMLKLLELKPVGFGMFHCSRLQHGYARVAEAVQTGMNCGTGVRIHG